MRKNLIALAAITGLMGLSGASAASVAPLHQQAQPAAIEKADWYCGPRCQYWRHRRWEESREPSRWEHRYHPYYGYGYGHRYYDYR